MIQKEALRQRGNLRVARQIVFERWTTLAKNGMLSSQEARAIFREVLDMNGGKRSLDSYPEAKAVIVAAQTYENQEGSRIEKANELKKNEALRQLQIQVDRDGPLTPEVQEQVRKDLAALGATPYELKSHSALRNIDEVEAELAAKEVRERISNGEFIPEGLLKQLTDKQLWKRARELNATRSVNMGLSKENADDVKGLIERLSVSHAGLIGHSSVAKPEAQEAEIRAKEEARRWLAANRGNYENEMQAVEALNRHLTDMFNGVGYERRGANGEMITGYDASPFNTKNQKNTEKSRLQFVRDKKDAQAHVSDLVNGGVPNPYAIGEIPGTKEELEKILADVKETGKIPPMTSNPRFMALADQANGTASYEEIVKSQLLAVHGFDFDATFPDRGGVQVLKEGQDGITLSEYEDMKVKKLLNMQPTRRTEFRAATDVHMSQNFQATGYTDGDLIADARTLDQRGYELNRGAIPGGYGGTVAAAAKKYGIPADVLAGLLQQESAWNPNAYNTSSGATGIAQIVPKWHPDITPGVDPHADIMYAASYLRRLIDNEAKGDLKTAIYMYNAGPGTVLQYGAGATKENREYYYNSPDLVSPNLRGRIYQLA